MREKKKQPVKKTTKKPSEKTVKCKKTNLKKGAALRTRDEYLKGGVPKPEYQDKPKQLYRVVFTVEVNANNEAAVVRRTTKKGRHLKSRPKEKFHEQIYTETADGRGIKVGDKFVRSTIDDLTQEDVEYIIKRCKFYPETKELLREFKNRGKNKKSPK